MKFNEIKKLVGNITTKKLKELMKKITPEEFQKEMKKEDGTGSIVNIIKRKIKQ
jgi:hypothetical protein